MKVGHAAPIKQPDMVQLSHRTQYVGLAVASYSCLWRLCSLKHTIKSLHELHAFTSSQQRQSNAQRNTVMLAKREPQPIGISGVAVRCVPLVWLVQWVLADSPLVRPK